MNPDLYTKAVLSIIALCFIWICVNGITPVTSAQGDVQKVIIAGWDRPVQVVLVGEDRRPLIEAQGLRVNVGDQTIPVAIRAIERVGPWQPIEVDVPKAAATAYPGR